MSKNYAVVVGSARGIGKAIHSLFKNNHMDVIGLDKNYPIPFGEDNPDLDFEFDVMSDHHHGFLENDFKTHGDKVSALIYCIGNNKLQWIDPSKSPGIGVLAQNIMNTNVVGIFKILETLMPYMTERCRIILYSSVAGDFPMRTTAPYCVSKAAVDMLTKCLARELAPMPVFCVKPGPTAGENSWADCMLEIQKQRDWGLDEIKAMTINDIPMKQLCTEEECAQVTLDLVVRTPAHASGTTIRLTGGR